MVRTRKKFHASVGTQSDVSAHAPVLALIESRTAIYSERWLSTGDYAALGSIVIVLESSKDGLAKAIVTTEDGIVKVCYVILDDDEVI